MNDNKLNYTYDNVIQLDEASTSRKFLSGVFTWMFVALAISAITTYLFTTNTQLMQLIIDPIQGNLTGLGYVAIFSPLAFSLIMQFGYNKISYPVLTLLFVAYALIMGVSLSIIFLAYTATSILGVFITASLLFAVMAAAGYYTTQDLTNFGSIMYTLFIGVFIALAVNWFLHSESMGYIISVIGAAVFIGLTAYYMQMLKRIGAGIEYGSASSKKLALIGALVLYITLINLFMMLLRIFGRRR